MGLWARPVGCVPRAPQVQLRAMPGWLLDCGEVFTPWVGQRGARGGPAWLWPRCSGRRVGWGPVACTPVTAPVPQSLWSRRHEGSYQELVTVPPWAAGPAENASSGNSEVPVTPQVGGAAMLMWSLSISLFPQIGPKMGCGLCCHLTQSHLSQELRSEGDATQTPCPY